jgi:two-component system cell cycle sensor histidine kinase/response regulator CckA
MSMPFHPRERSSVTEVNPLEHHLTDEAKRVSALAFESVSEGVVITDSARRIVLVNPAFEAITGYALEEVKDRNCSLLHGPQTDGRALDAMAQGLQRHAAFSGEILNYRKDGSTFWNDLSISPLRDDEGRLTHFIGLMRDITERKHAVVALEEAEVRYRDAAEAAGGYVLDMDLEFRYTFVSERAEQLLGYAAHEIVGRTPAEFMPPGEIDNVNAWFEKNHRPGEVVRGLEHRVLTKAGAEVWLQVSRILLKAGDGTITGYRGTAFDITPRKLAEAANAALEAQMREAQKMEAIGTLAGGIAHDFNNIIAAILGNVNLARQDVSPISPALESLDEIHKAASRARDLVRQILSFSRRQQTQYQCIDLAPIVTDTARMLRAMMPARLMIDAHCAPRALGVRADASQMQQAIINLATNAMQAMGGQPGRIRIGLDTVHVDESLLTRHPTLRGWHKEHHGDLARITVSDDGPGMDEATVGRIFEPFFTTKPVGEGTGLGLAVVHGIVQGHDGLIVVDSQIGLGTQFTLYFPGTHTELHAHANSPSQEGHAAVAPPQTARPNASTSTGAEKPHIVYVDDDEALVFLVKRLLERRGYRVSAHHNQRSALNAIAADPAGVDLFLTDYNMPGMSGLELAAHVKQIRADLPIGIASGFIDETLSSQAAKAGIQGLLLKATAVDEFCRAIEALLPQPT